MRKHVILATGIAVCLAATACGGDRAERDLEQASRDLAETRAAAETAREQVGERQAALDEAQQKLDEARKALRALEADLQGLEAKLDQSATDAVLFRSVQKHLLEDGDLASVAIAARVEKGVVTLSGSVPTAELRDRAVEIARATPGVSSVQTQIRVEKSPESEK